MREEPKLLLRDGSAALLSAKNARHANKNFGSSFIKNNSLWIVWLSAAHGDKIR